MFKSKNPFCQPVICYFLVEMRRNQMARIGANKQMENHQSLLAMLAEPTKMFWRKAVEEHIFTIQPCNSVEALRNFIEILNVRININ